MALASILSGIAGGILAFLGALISGQGLIFAMGYYVVGGTFFTVLTLGILILRCGRTQMRPRMVPLNA